MERGEVIRQIQGSWIRHNDILLFLLTEVPEKAMTAKPANLRGRDVARQFAHLARVREGWVHYHRSGKRPKLPRVDKGEPPSRAVLKRSLVDTGKNVGDFLAEALEGEAKPRMFRGEVIRWMAYLISHESHHRGSIMLALKQGGFRLPEKVAVRGLWGRWISGQ